MEISCLPVSYFSKITSGEMSIRQWAALGKQAGLRNVDLSCMFLSSHVPVYLDSLRKDLAEEKMHVKMITTYPDFSHPCRHQRERELAYLMRDIAVASYLEVPYVRITAGQNHPGADRRKTIEAVAEYFKKAAGFADGMEVTLVYENHANPSAWHYVDFSFPTGIFLEIAERIKDTSIKINFDTANPVAYRDEKECLSLLRQVVHRLGTVHVADTSTRGSLNHTTIGTGLVPFGEVFSFLKASGYDGLFSIEEGSNTGLDGVRAAVDFVRKSWEKA